MNLTLKDICLEIEDIIYLISGHDLANLQDERLMDDMPVNLIVGVDGQEELDSATELTRGHDLNLVSCNGERNLDDIPNSIQDLLMAKQALLSRPAALFDTIIKGRGIPYILEIAGELLENPVLLGDGNHRLIGS